MADDPVDPPIPSSDESPPGVLLLPLTPSCSLPTIRNDPIPLYTNKGEIHQEIDWNEGIMD